MPPFKKIENSPILLTVLYSKCHVDVEIPRGVESHYQFFRGNMKLNNIGILEWVIGGLKLNALLALGCG